MKKTEKGILEFAAKNKIKTVLTKMNTTLRGLSEDEVQESRSAHGKNKVTHEKKKTLLQRVAGAFVNPFTAILFFWLWYLLLPISLCQLFMGHQRMQIG